MLVMQSRDQKFKYFWNSPAHSLLPNQSFWFQSQTPLALPEKSSKLMLLKLYLCLLDNLQWLMSIVLISSKHWIQCYRVETYTVGLRTCAVQRKKAAWNIIIFLLLCKITLAAVLSMRPSICSWLTFQINHLLWATIRCWKYVQQSDVQQWT